MLSRTHEYWERLAADNRRDDDQILGRSKTLSGKYADLTTTKLHDLIQPDQHILDLGAGYGRYTIPIAQRGARVVSVDLSLSMIHRLRLNLRENHQDADIVRADLRQLPFRPQVFSGAICVATFYYLPKRYWWETLTQFASVLTSQGWLFLSLKSIRYVLTWKQLFGLLHLGAYLILMLEGKIRLFQVISDKLGLHGRTDYLISIAGGKKVLSDIFEIVVPEGKLNVFYLCQVRRRIE